jgi:hypothetical protein
VESFIFSGGVPTAKRSAAQQKLATLSSTKAVTNLALVKNQTLLKFVWQTHP